MGLIYNATNTFMGLGYTDITIVYFLIIIASLFFIMSRVPWDKENKVPNILFSLLSFIILIGSLFMSANVATYVVQPQYIENTIYYDNTSLSANNTMSRIYNGSAIDVIPQNSTILSVILIIISVFAFMNFIELLYTLFEVGKTKIKVQS
jgi:uncharacterized membrane protein YidH (DUF202 family)